RRTPSSGKAAVVAGMGTSACEASSPMSCLVPKQFGHSGGGVVVDTDRTRGNQRAYETSPVRAADPIDSALLVAGVAEVHQFPDRVVLVGLNQLTTAIPRDLDVADESQVGTVEVRQLGGDAFEALDGVDHPVCRQVMGAGKRHHVAVLAVPIA